MTEIFSPEALQNELKKLEDNKTLETGIGVVVKDSDVGVTGSIQKDVGKNWTFLAEGSWMRKAGKSFVAMFTKKV